MISNHSEHPELLRKHWVILPKIPNSLPDKFTPTYMRPHLMQHFMVIFVD